MRKIILSCTNADRSETWCVASDDREAAKRHAEFWAGIGRQRIAINGKPWPEPTPRDEGAP